MKTKRLWRKSFTVAAIGIMMVGFASSCNNSENPNPPPAPSTVLTLVKNNPDLAILAAAITKAGLDTALNNAANLTIFAPTNAAFIAAGFPLATINALTPLDVTSVLTPILTYHVLGKKVLAADIPVSDTVATLSGKNIFASKNVNGSFVNGVRITAADAIASNGAVHTIAKVLTPPTRSIFAIVSGNANLSLLQTAITRGLLDGALSGPGKFTVFAPLNSGFPVSLNTPEAINTVPADAVGNLVKSHAFGTSIFSSVLVAGVTGPTLNPATTLTIGLAPNKVGITGSTKAPSNIVAVDSIALNGVVHIIDSLLQ